MKRIGGGSHLAACRSSLTAAWICRLTGKPPYERNGASSAAQQVTRCVEQSRKTVMTAVPRSCASSALPLALLLKSDWPTR